MPPCVTLSGVLLIGAVGGDSKPSEAEMTRRFEPGDITDEVPAEGYYAGVIRSARWRESERGSRMIQVLYALAGVAPAYGCVAEYFVLEGASERGAAMARRRLVEVFRACGLEPQPGDAISIAPLVGRGLLVRLEHDEYNGRPRLRVVGHRELEPEKAGPC